MDRRNPYSPLPAILVALVVLAGACSPSVPTEPPADPSTQPLSPPTLEVLGTFAGEEIADPDRTYILADGRRLHVSIDTTRVLFDGGGLGQPVVLGSDANGEFVAVFTHQNGVPADCHLPGIAAVGIERGAFIEIKGILWRKSPSFRSPVAVPPNGREFSSSTRFCFNDQAQVASIIP
jgi:hypothetical protein